MNTAVKEFKPSTSSTTSSAFLEKLSANLSTLYLSKLWSDVKINCKGKTIYCHKNILAARSKYFANQFRRDENLIEFVEDDNSEQSIRLVLHYIYTGVVCFGDDASAATFVDVFTLATNYQLDELITASAEKVKQTITVDNVLKVFSRTSSLKDVDVIDYCSQFIGNNAADVLKSHQFNRLSMELLIDLFKRISVGNEMRMTSVWNWLKRNPGADTAKLLAALDGETQTNQDLTTLDSEDDDDADDLMATIVGKRENGSCSDDSDCGDLPLIEELSFNCQERNKNNAEEKHVIQSSTTLKYDNRFESSTTKRQQTQSSGQAIIYEVVTNCINAIRMELSNSVGYEVFVCNGSDGKSESKWNEIVNYAQYKCHSEQHLYFESRRVRFVKVVGSAAMIIDNFRVFHFNQDTKNMTTFISGSVVYVPHLTVGYTARETSMRNYNNLTNQTIFHLNQPMMLETFVVQGTSASPVTDAEVEVSENEIDWISGGIFIAVGGKIVVALKPRVTMFVRVTTNAYRRATTINLLL